MSVVRTRFAPSPTGYLHIGGARTALYNYLFAKAQGGEFVLRIEDTDLERSKREYEEAQVKDLLWLGITPDESPANPGKFGPYRQSERLDIYNKYAWELVEKGHAYPCFLTSEELEALSAKAEDEKIAPHTYHGKYRDYPLAEAKARIEKGEEYAIRFKNPGIEWSFTDMVRGHVTFPVDMVGDFVIIRSNKMPVYNYCCVIDDHLMEISHVIRAEEHLNNTVRQLMIYDAIGAKPPIFAHVSLLVGEDRQKLSKRHGATSVLQYKEQNYLPDAMVNYLCLLGWSHPEEKDIFNVNELGQLFGLDRFSKSSALYDVKKLNFFNEQHLRKLSTTELVAGIANATDSASAFHKMDTAWQEKFAELIREKIQLFSDAASYLDMIFVAEGENGDDVKEALSWETTPQIHDYIKGEIANVNTEFVTEEMLDAWMDHLKKELKIKGKPLFMGTRVVLTGRCHGPDLRIVVALTPVKILKERLEK